MDSHTPHWKFMTESLNIIYTITSNVRITPAIESQYLIMSPRESFDSFSGFGVFTPSSHSNSGTAADISQQLPEPSEVRLRAFRHFDSSRIAQSCADFGNDVRSACLR